MGGKGYRPLSAIELMVRLSLPLLHTQIFQKVLNTLVKQGNIELVHEKYIWKQNQAEVVTGVLSVHPARFRVLTG